MSKKSMTKRDIARMISDEVGLTHQKTQQVMQSFLDVLVEVLATEGQIELRNFGVFKVKDLSARLARNPQTGEKIEVPERTGISFKAGKEMEQRVEDYSARRASRLASLREVESGSYPKDLPVRRESSFSKSSFSKRSNFERP